MELVAARPHSPEDTARAEKCVYWAEQSLPDALRDEWCGSIGELQHGALAQRRCGTE